MTSPTHKQLFRRNLRMAILVMLLSLLMGVLGYHYTDDMPWVDSLLNASMILGGMGPVGDLHSTASKLFASFYALYSCFLALGLITLFIGPVMHDTLKRFHSDPGK